MDTNMDPKSLPASARAEEVVRAWWRDLHDNQTRRGERATLRRAGSPTKAMMEPASNRLRDELIAEGIFPEAFQDGLDRLGLIACVLAHAESKEGQGRRLSKLLAGGEGGDSGKRMNDIRFRRLITTDALDDLFRELRRAVQFVDGPVDAGKLFTDVWNWNRPHDNPRRRWAIDYYSTPKKSSEQE